MTARLQSNHAQAHDITGLFLKFEAASGDKCQFVTLKSLKLERSESDILKLDAQCKQMTSWQLPEVESGCDASETNSQCVVTQVQEAVHGVTIEECRAALQNHNWSVQKAVHYLKVRAFITTPYTAASHRKPNQVQYSPLVGSTTSWCHMNNMVNK